MFDSYEAAAAFVRERAVRMIDLKFGDLWGRWHHLTLSADEFSPALLANGVGFDGANVGLRSARSGDMVLTPDLATGALDPFWDEPTLSFLCNTLEAESKAPYGRDPRHILRRAEAYLQATGIADASHWGPEFEFYVFQNVSFENDARGAAYRVDALEADWHAGETGTGYAIPAHAGYHAIPPRDQLYGLRSRIAQLLEQMGVPIKYHHHEAGAPGQCEIEVPLMGALAAADAALTIKYVARLAAGQVGQTVTFLPKPLYGEAGSGMHFHQHLLQEGRNLFYDPGGYALLSQTAQWYIGGLLDHAPALLALTNPSTNSYRRLVPGGEAPVNRFFSCNNRSAAIRVPRYVTQPELVRFEFRPPDATCNPYLAMAAMLLAGLDGIQRRVDPIAAGFGPFDDDIQRWPPERRTALGCLPADLGEAAAALRADQGFLLAGDVFPQDLLDDWITAKAQEHEALQSRPHPWEVQIYWDL